MQVHEVRSTPLIDYSPRLSIIGSSNGLLCFANNQYLVYPPSLLLWNPATREVRQLPTTRTTDYFVWNFTVGFGFSPIVNDYMIVTTFAVYNGVLGGVQVYSLSTGLWKEITFGNFGAVSLFGPTVAANGAIFWYGIKREKGGDKVRVVVSFDIGMEAFTLIPWPALPCDSSSKLTVYEDKLAIIADYKIRY